MTNNEARNKGTAKSWKRANRLAEMVDGATPGKARTFLSTNKGTYDALLDAKTCDKRNPAVREMLDHMFLFTEQIGRFGKTDTNTTRASEGDSSRPPRAGAPKKGTRKYTKRKYTKRGSQNGSQNGSHLLEDIRNLQRKHRTTLSELIISTELLGRLVDEPIDLTKIARQH